jgi:hypothetical protein
VHEPGVAAQPGSSALSFVCSNHVMAVQRPAWWCYPERCANGHEWAPALVIVSWSMCDCAPALAARTADPSGHLAVYCRAPGCRSVWYRPRCERRG